MLGICMRYCKDKQTAEDILQEGFLKVFRNIQKFRKEGSFEGWIKRIMVNSSVDHYKSSLKHLFHDSIDEIKEISILDREDEEPFSYGELGLTREKIMEMVRELPDGYRIVFNLYAVEEYSHKEIALKLGISESTSKTQLMKARKLLKRSIHHWVMNQEPKKII